MLQQQQSVGFQSVRQTPMPPYLESARDLLFEKLTPDQFYSQRLSMVYLQESENQKNFIMSKDEASTLINKTYPNSKKISETEIISDRQIAKKVYHLNGLDINPEEYGMSKDDLNEICKQTWISLLCYEGQGTLPPIELIYEGQKKIEEICQDKTIFRKENGGFGRKVKRPSNFYSNRNIRHIIYFDKFTGDLITGDKFRRTYFNEVLTLNNRSISDNNEKN